MCVRAHATTVSLGLFSMPPSPSYIHVHMYMYVCVCVHVTLSLSQSLSLSLSLSVCVCVCVVLLPPKHCHVLRSVCPEGRGWAGRPALGELHVLYILCNYSCIRYPIAGNQGK